MLKSKEQHDWADPEEPASCPIDRHVGEQLKYEMKQPTGSEYGADLQDIVGGGRSSARGGNSNAAS